MIKQVSSGLRCLAVSLLIGGLCLPAHADNQMGYRLLSQDDAQDLPHNHGALGMDIEAAQRITDGGMTFDLIRVKQVRSGSAGEQAGFHPGDEIIAVDGEVFSSLAVIRGLRRLSSAGEPGQRGLHPGWRRPATGSTHRGHRRNGGADATTGSSGGSIQPAAVGPFHQNKSSDRRGRGGAFRVL